MKRILVVVALVAGLLFGHQIVPTSAATTGFTVSGVITDPEGNPVPGVLINGSTTSPPLGFFNGVSNSSGAYSVAVPTPGMYRVSFRPSPTSGLDLATQIVDLTAADAVVNVQLPRLDVTFSGTVKDANGTGMQASLGVSSLSGKFWPGLSDSSGAFSFLVGSGDAVVRVSTQPPAVGGPSSGPAGGITFGASSFVAPARTLDVVFPAVQTHLITAKSSTGTVLSGMTYTFSANQFGPVAPGTSVVTFSSNGTLNGPTSVGFYPTTIPATVSVTNPASGVVVTVPVDLTADHTDVIFPAVADSDGDGVDDAVENTTPYPFPSPLSTPGDGNADGVKDSSQSTVASLPINGATPTTASGYITVTSPAPLTAVATSTPSSLGSPPASWSFPAGVISATTATTVSPISPIGNGTFRIIAFGGAPFTQKFGIVSSLDGFIPLLGTYETQTSGLVALVLVVGDQTPYDQDPRIGFVRIVGGLITIQSPPTIICPSELPVFSLGQPDATITVNVTNGPTPTITLPVDTSVPGFRSLTFTATNAGGSTSTSCAYEVFSADRDGDGVNNLVEDTVPSAGAPTFGDGNGDGTLDSLQSEVTSLPASGGTAAPYVTVGASQAMKNVSTSPSANLIGTPPSWEFVNGVVNITLETSTTATLRFFLPPGSGPVTTVGLTGLAPSALTATPLQYSNGALASEVTVSDQAGYDQDPRVGFIRIVGGPITLTPPPTITCPSPLPSFAFGESGAVVTVTVTNGGVSSISLPASTSTAGTKSLTFTASNVAGPVSVSCSYIVREPIPLPRITCPTPPTFTLGSTGAIVSASVANGFTATVSGPADTATAGVKNVVLGATGAGGSASALCQYFVTPAFILKSPLTIGDRTLRAGKKLEVEFLLTNARGGGVSDRSMLVSVTWAPCGSSAAGTPAALKADAARDGTWELKVESSGLRPGCYDLRLAILGAPTSYVIPIQIR